MGITIKVKKNMVTLMLRHNLGLVPESKSEGSAKALAPNHDWA